MKNITLLFLMFTLIMFVGCREITTEEIERQKRFKGFEVVVIDSCEYLKYNETYGHQGYGYFAHKGNCKFCAERRKQ